MSELHEKNDMPLILKLDEALNRLKLAAVNCCCMRIDKVNGDHLGIHDLAEYVTYHDSFDFSWTEEICGGCGIWLGEKQIYPCEKLMMKIAEVEYMVNEIYRTQRKVMEYYREQNSDE